MTTKQSTYDKIVALLDKEGLINKELSFGCEVYNLPTNSILTVYKSFWTDFYCVEDIHEHCISHYEILWHPPYITDVLRWFDKKRYIWSLHSDGELAISSPIFNSKVHIIKINITYPLLKDQDEETLESLYNLMENIIWKNEQ